MVFHCKCHMLPLRLKVKRLGKNLTTSILICPFDQSWQGGWSNAFLSAHGPPRGTFCWGRWARSSPVTGKRLGPGYYMLHSKGPFAFSISPCLKVPCWSTFHPLFPMTEHKGPTFKGASCMHTHTYSHRHASEVKRDFENALQVNHSSL